MPPPEAPTLAELQARFQAALVDGDDGVLALIPPNTRASNAVLLGVYRNAYVARLVEVLGNAYPVLAAYMGEHLGEEAFDAVARRYVADFPSRTANARWYGTHLPELLAREDFSMHPELREVALLERQLDAAFDAPDAPVLDLAGLAAHPPEAWGDLVFRTHPSAALLVLGSNAFDIWCAVKDGGEAPRACRLVEPHALLVWRRVSVPVARRLEAEERMLWAEAAGGKSFSGLAEMAATFDDPASAALRVAQYLNAWLADGLLSEAMTQRPNADRLVRSSGHSPQGSSHASQS
ncbi:MAG: putative DNA-binding domain-containing protein [Hyphomicrobium sp.]|uniref:HvfC/BufC family peptide modification chaperone n=1 Tax=Hyphomicrobium sp. TaxID=82 RepID=UPI003D0C6F7B